MAVHPIKLATDTQRHLAHRYVDAMPEGGVIRFEPEPKRSLEQNAKLWAMLGDISKQAEHNGMRHSPETWKALFMHACGHEVAFQMGLNGEPFPVGFRSSAMTVSQMSDLIEFISAWAAQHGVAFTERGF
ncbi:recombination protein NinB [Thalassobius sp. S69A]|uniref:recombination protein NinB n=1 Tax=unclassified Thalassovita TaxID=2619711 RepID=UPI003C7BD413